MSRHHNHHGPGAFDFIVWTLVGAGSWLLVIAAVWALIALGRSI